MIRIIDTKAEATRHSMDARSEFCVTAERAGWDLEQLLPEPVCRQWWPLAHDRDGTHLDARGAG